MSTNLFSEKSVTKKRIGSSKLLQYANESREEGFFNDVTVQVENLSIPASRMVLACHSKFFEAMFKTNMKEKYDPTVKIEGVKGTAVKTIIDYLYTESIKIDSEFVMDLMAAADYLQIDDVKGFCQDFLETIVSPKNSIAILNAAKLYEINAFTAWIYAYIHDHLDEIALTSAFKSLSKLELIECLNKETKKNVEESKCKALILWIKHEQKTRQNLMEELFENILDLNKVSVELIEQFLLKEQLIRSNSVCYEQVLNAYSKSLKDRSSTIALPSQSKVISFGGEKTQSGVFDVYSFHCQGLLSYPDLPENIHSHCALKLDDFVYCIGGKKKINRHLSDPSNTVWRINMKQDTPEWREVASMKSNRYEFGAAVYRNSLVVAGGCGETYLNSAELYDVALDVWSNIASLKIERTSCALAENDDRLYAIGGRNFHDVVSSVEALLDTHGEWVAAASMQTPRHLLAAVACKGYVYAIGGQNRSHFSTALKSVEKYDANTNAWSFVSPMNSSRFRFSACVLNDKIIVVGGRDEDNGVVHDIECYDPLKDTWVVVTTLKNDLENHAVVAV